MGSFQQTCRSVANASVGRRHVVRVRDVPDEFASWVRIYRMLSHSLLAGTDAAPDDWRNVVLWQPAQHGCIARYAGRHIRRCWPTVTAGSVHDITLISEMCVPERGGDVVVLKTAPCEPTSGITSSIWVAASIIRRGSVDAILSAHIAGGLQVSTCRSAPCTVELAQIA
jgi:hypothetical protein